MKSLVVMEKELMEKEHPTLDDVFALIMVEFIKDSLNKMGEEILAQREKGV